MDVVIGQNENLEMGNVNVRKKKRAKHAANPAIVGERAVFFSMQITWVIYFIWGATP